MARLIFFACAAAAIAIGLAICSVGFAWTAGGLVTLFLCWLGYVVYVAHLDFLAAETAFFDQIDSWKSGGISRKEKQKERKSEVDWEARATITALLTPAARYRDFHTGEQDLRPAGNNSIMRNSDGPYAPLVLQDDGTWMRQNHTPIVTVQVIHEQAPTVNFNLPGAWMRELNEKDRGKGSLRKSDLKANAVLLCILYQSGPAAARREIAALRRNARQKEQALPTINAHSEHLSHQNQVIVWLALRLFQHQSVALLKPMTQAPATMEWRA